jgi:pimeloyl-ACP methyl ester carboxylesterase
LQTNIPVTGIAPFYFGAPGKHLFGIYHAPQSGPPRDCGVVLCSPMGREYINSHRALRQLAVRLSAAGFPVLRFDFYGCGDSSGECEQGQIDQWLADLSTAVEEMRKRCGFVKICLVGLRLGGTLAAMVGARRGDIDSLVLWDAVSNGQAYLEELLAFAKLQHCPTDANQADIWGFPLTYLMRTDLEHIDLLAIPMKPANNILLLESRQEADEGPLREHFERMGSRIDDQHCPGPQNWREEPYRRVVPVEILQAVVSWISEVYP